MNEQTPSPVDPGSVEPVALAKALGDRYLSYALSTIMARSLPDVRDGLKPVHRRLLYAMRLLRLDPNAGFKKCARIVGDVMGKYHPHGDQAIYDALVRLAQEFAARYPLIEGQGNFGNVDGDNAAAMRYTEARLTEIAELLLQDIDADTVDFRETYDGEDSEPIVLPSAFPNLLANGAAGIAVGMATSIPPHNAVEICDALLHLIKHPNARMAKLVELIPGPDFPTGGTLVEPAESILEAYDTGRGGFRVRAKWEKEDTGRGTYQIVITEMPYQVQKGKLVEKIAELIASRKVPALADVRDESTEEVRLILEPRSRTVEAETLMEHMFRLTDLETRFGFNMNVLGADKTPRVMNLREVLQAFLDHRHEVLIRRSKHRLEKIARRLEILEGYLIAFLNLDEVIRIIREEDEPKQVMMERFELTEVQAEAILNMRLRQLRKLEELEIRSEHKDLSAEQRDLRGLLKNEDRRWKVISGELTELKKSLQANPAIGKRRTAFGDAPSSDVAPLETMIEREPITVILSEKGWIRAAKGHLAPDAELKFKEGDKGRFTLHGQTTDKLLLFATNGRFYTLGCDKLPSARGHGEPVRLLAGIGADEDVVGALVHQSGRKLVVASSDGRGFIVAEDEVVAQTRNGKQVLNVGAKAEAQVCTPAEGDSVAVVGTNRKLLIIERSELPEMTRGRGVIMQKYKDAELSDVKVFDLKEGLTWTSATGRTYTEANLRDWQGKRAQAGRIVPRGFNKSNRFS